jgi:CysZ protein
MGTNHTADNPRIPQSTSLLPAPLYVLRGALFLWRHRVLWKYAAAPLAISTAVLGMSYVVLYYFVRKFLTPLTTEAWYVQALYYLLLIVLVLLFAVIFFFLFARVASALAAPFNEVISQKTEELVTGSFIETPFSVVQLVRDSTRAIVHSFRVLGIYVGLLIAALLLLLVPGAGPLLFSAAGALLSAYMFAYEYLGYCMDRRRFSFREKQSFLRSQFRSVMGFGLGSVAAATIPVVNILFIPAAVVGGTLLFLELHSPDGRNSVRP